MTDEIDLPLLAHEFGHVAEIFSTHPECDSVMIINPAPDEDLLVAPQGIVPTPEQWARNCLYGPAVGYWFRLLQNGASTEDMHIDFHRPRLLERIMADPATSHSDRITYAAHPVDDPAGVILQSTSIAYRLHKNPGVLHYIGNQLEKQGYAEIVAPRAKSRMH